MALPPIKLTCNASGESLWRVNGTDYTNTQLINGVLLEHNYISNGTGILVNSPVNNTEYICVSHPNSSIVIISDPVYIIIAGKCLTSLWFIIGKCLL